MQHRSAAICDHSLGKLSNLLTKAEVHCTAKGIPPGVMLALRQFADMPPLGRQVQLACDFAGRAGARRGAEAPRRFSDTETSFAELQARIRAVRAFLAGVEPAGPDGVGVGADAFRHLHFLSRFYFHLTSASNILRHHGVALGRGDRTGT